METFSGPYEGNPPVTGGFPLSRPVTRSFDIFIDLRLNKRLSKQSIRRWFETPSRSLWHHCNGLRYFCSGLNGHWAFPLQLCHNELAGVSNHQRHDYLFNRLITRRAKKTSKLRVTGLYVGNSPVTGESPHRGPVTRKMFPFDDVIMRPPIIVGDIFLHAKPWIPGGEISIFTAVIH